MYELLQDLFESKADDVLFTLAGGGVGLRGRVHDILDGGMVVLVGRWSHVGGVPLVEVVIPASNVLFYTVAATQEA